MPDSVVVSCHGDEGRGVKPGEVAFRLHFEAEHSNVLVVTAELLTGCLTPVEVISVVRMGLVTEHTPDGPQLVSLMVKFVHTMFRFVEMISDCISVQSVHEENVEISRLTAFVCVLMPM